MDCVRNLEFNLQYKISADYHMMFNFYRKGIRFCYIPMIVSVYDAVRGLSKKMVFAQSMRMRKCWVLRKILGLGFLFFV